MGWTVSSGPASEPISLTEAKLWLKVDVTADDNLITDLITSARKFVERQTNTAMITQTIVEKFDAFPQGSINAEAIIRLAVSPVQSVTSITYIDTDGTSQTLSSANYVVDTTSRPARIGLDSTQFWPSTIAEVDAVTITYVAGYTATSDANFPAELLDAMYLIIASRYENRQDFAKRYEDKSKQLIDSVKVFEF